MLQVRAIKLVPMEICKFRRPVKINVYNTLEVAVFPVSSDEEGEKETN